MASTLLHICDQEWNVLYRLAKHSPFSQPFCAAFLTLATWDFSATLKIFNAFLRPNLVLFSLQGESLVFDHGHELSSSIITPSFILRTIPRMTRLLSHCVTTSRISAIYKIHPPVELIFAPGYCANCPSFQLSICSRAKSPMIVWTESSNIAIGPLGLLPPPLSYPMPPQANSGTRNNQ